MDRDLTVDERVYVRDDFICAYCGFDGRPFHNWRQLTIDHIRPSASGGSDDIDNKVVACHSCNSITSSMKFATAESREAIVAKKRVKVHERMREHLAYWHLIRHHPERMPAA